MNKKEKWLLGTAGAGLGFLGVQLAVFWILFPNPKKCWEQDTYDCALVCGYHAKEDGSPTDVMKKRVEKAIDIRIVSSAVRRGGGQSVCGSGSDEKICPGTWRARAVSCPGETGRLHVPQLEIRAVTMKNCGFSDCAVVTSGWHLRKADHYARRAGLRYVMVKADEPESERLWTTLKLHLSTAWVMYRNLWKGYY